MVKVEISAKDPLLNEYVKAQEISIPAVVPIQSRLSSPPNG